MARYLLGIQIVVVPVILSLLFHLCRSWVVSLRDMAFLERVTRQHLGLVAIWIGAVPLGGVGCHGEAAFKEDRLSFLILLKLL